MLSLSHLRRHPRHFRTFTGITPEEFDQLFVALTPVYQNARRAERDRDDRQRAPGAGRPFALPLPDKLLLGLVFLRLYPSLSFLACLFALDKSNVQRELKHRLLPALQEVLPTPLRDAPLRTKEGGNQEGERKLPKLRTLKQLLDIFPELGEVLLDATEQPVEQPKDKQKRKQAYSGKKRDHTVKTQIVVSQHLVLHAFGGLPGCLHDLTLARASGVLSQIPSAFRVRVDRGYEGLAKASPEGQVVSPVKKKKGQVLSVVGRLYNRMLSSLRMPVEHHFARLKRFGCLSDVWRGSSEDNEDAFCLVAGLLNFRHLGRLNWAEA